MEVLVTGVRRVLGLEDRSKEVRKGIGFGLISETGLNGGNKNRKGRRVEMEIKTFHKLPEFLEIGMVIEASAHQYHFRLN